MSRRPGRARQIQLRRARRGFLPTIQALERRQLLASAVFERLDVATRGDWPGHYGGDGFDIARDTGAANPALPAYAQVSIGGSSGVTWSTDAADVRNLRDAAGDGRIAGYNRHSTIPVRARIPDHFRENGVHRAAPPPPEDR